MKKNLIISCDSYKLTHHLQYVPGITKLYSYAEPRKGGKYKSICFFGLQYIIAEHFLNKITDNMIEEAEQTCLNTFGTTVYFNKEVWQKVRDLGYLPIKIMSAPEGTIISEGNVAFTIESTEPWFASSIGALETLLLTCWYPTTVATRSMNLKKAITPYFDKTSDVKSIVLPNAILDFGMRGSTSFESASLGGAAHLIHFDGSDNEAGAKLIKDYYEYTGKLKSVFATEHSSQCSFGPEGQIDYLLHQLSVVPDDKILSVVIDGYNADDFILNVACNPKIVEIIKKRTGRVVFREDSGDILKNLLKHSDILTTSYGLEVNSKNYKIIGSNVGLLQADGMDEISIPETYKDYTNAGWAADNFIAGSGGGLLQVDINRDVNRWALKASYGEKDGIPFDIRKTPKTDMSKQSKGGKLKLHPTGASFMTIESSKESPQNFNSFVDIMRPLYNNGKFYPDSFENIINRARI